MLNVTLTTCRDKILEITIEEKGAKKDRMKTLKYN
jgi:hypothetical protein